MNGRLPVVSLAVVLAAVLPPPHAASEVDPCAADRYEACSSFQASVSLGQHERIIDNHVAGFTRSEGSWTISVRYLPDTQCAKVDILLDAGPVDVPLEYRESLADGVGEIRDAGTFMHKIDGVETALGILSSNCRVPKSEEAEPDTAEGGDDALDEEERERLALEEERERLALEREREQLVLAGEQERLALERERGDLQRDLEAARERQRLAQARARRLAAEERERERLAQLQAEFERQQEELDRLLSQPEPVPDRDARDNASEGNALGSLLTGLGIGALVGAVATGDAEALGAASDLFDNAARIHSFSGDTYAAGGADCEAIGERLARDLDRASASAGMCGMARGMAQALSRARNDRAAMNCASSQELADMDRSIREAQATAQASCGSN